MSSERVAHNSRVEFLAPLDSLMWIKNKFGKIRIFRVISDINKNGHKIWTNSDQYRLDS